MKRIQIKSELYGVQKISRQPSGSIWVNIHGRDDQQQSTFKWAVNIMQNNTNNAKAVHLGLYWKNQHRILLWTFLFLFRRGKKSNFCNYRQNQGRLANKSELKLAYIFPRKINMSSIFFYLEFSPNKVKIWGN